MREPIHHERATVDELGLHFLRAGSGPPVVLLHGFPLTSHMWRRLIPLLSDRHTVIAPDLKGMGDSGRPATGYDTPTIARELVALITQLELGPVHLVGYDVGGWIAYAWAAHHPDTVRTVTILDVFVPGLGLEDLRGTLWHLGFFAERDLPERLLAGHERDYVRWVLTHGAYDPTTHTDADLETYARPFLTGGFRGALEHYRALDASAAMTKNSPLTMPVLAVGGDHSPVGAALEDHLRPVASDLTFALLERCGHFPAEERPHELAELLLTHIAQHSP